MAVAPARAPWRAQQLIWVQFTLAFFLMNAGAVAHDFRHRDTSG